MARVEDIAPRRVGRFLDAEDRAALAGVPIKLTAIDYEPNAMFGPRWLVGAAIVATGEEVLIGLSGTTKDKAGVTIENAGRTAVLGRILDALTAGTDVDPVILYKDAAPLSPWLFRSATDEELAEWAEPTWPVEAEAVETPVAVGGPKLVKAGAK